MQKSQGIETIFVRFLVFYAVRGCDGVLHTTDKSNSDSIEKVNSKMALPTNMKRILPLQNLIRLLLLFWVLAAMSGCAVNSEKSGLGSNHSDLWDRLRASLQLQNAYKVPKIRGYRAWFQRNQNYLNRSTKRGSRYLYHIVEEIERRGMPGEIALLPVIESAFRPFAYSPAHAAGIWQFIPSTGKRYGLKQNWWYDGRRDILASTRAALDYLQHLHRKFDGDWLLAIAAYNTGEGNIAQAIKRNRRAGKDTDFWSLGLSGETRSYVPRLLALSSVVSDPDRYNLTLRKIPNRPYFEKVPVDGQIDFSLAAKLSGVPVSEIRKLNPAYPRWVTAPDGPHYLLIPKSKVKIFRKGLASLSKKRQVGWRHHVVRKGESLGVIARRFGVTVAVLRQVNRIQGNIITVGQSILVPATKVRTLSASDGAAIQQRKRVAKGKDKKKSHIHVVQPGDNLSLIAHRYHVSLEKLISWNNIAHNNIDILLPGQRLKVYR